MSEKIGRFEYVKRGLVGVCAATMLAGMCAVPAFAADASLTATDGEYSAEANTTTVSATVSSQVSATIPTTVPAYIGTNGAIQFPESMSIATDSVTAMKITGVQAKALGDVKLAADLDSAGSTPNTVAMKLKVGNETAIDLSSATAASSPLTTSLTASAPAAVVLEGSIANVTGATTSQALQLVELTWTITAA